MYTYKDFKTGTMRRTRGEFLGWHYSGTLNTWFAKFQLDTNLLYVREYLLTKETKRQLSARV